jgi:hypothetical protein
MYRATKALVAINAIMGILALVGLGYSIAVVAQGGKLCVDCLAVPVEWGWAAFGITLGIVLVSIFAIIAAWRHVKSMLIIFVLFTFITFAITTALTVIVSMWTSATDLGALQGTILILENQLKSFLALWSQDHRSDWFRIQANLGCCGVDLVSTYLISTWPTTLHTGPACNGTVDAVIMNIQAGLPDVGVFSDLTLLKAKTAQVTQANTNHIYFCEQEARLAAQEYTAVVAAVLAVLSFLQLVAFGLGCYLLCGVKREDGGFAEVDEKTGELQSPLKAFIQAPLDVASDTKAFANRVSTRINMNVAPVANRVSMRMGFTPMFNMPPPPTGLAPISGPPPGMPPPGMGGMGNPVMSNEMNGAGSRDFGAKYEKYVRMKKSGLPMGAVKNAMERDQVQIPAGFFDGDEEDGNVPVKPAPPAKRGGFGAPPPGPPPFQAIKSLANRVSVNMQRGTNRVSMNMKGLFGGGGMFSPPPPPPGFGELPAEGMNNAFAGSSPFGGATPNPSYGGAPPPRFNVQAVPEEFSSLPPPPKAAPAPKAAKAAPPPKAAPAPKKAAKKGGGGGGGGGGPGFLADIASAGGATGPSAFGLKKTVTNDRSAPNFSA